MALSPDRRLLYAARRSEPLAVLAFAHRRAPSGRSTLLGEAAAAGQHGPHRGRRQRALAVQRLVRRQPGRA